MLLCPHLARDAQGQGRRRQRRCGVGSSQQGGAGVGGGQDEVRLMGVRGQAVHLGRLLCTCTKGRLAPSPSDACHVRAGWGLAQRHPLLRTSNHAATSSVTAGTSISVQGSTIQHSTAQCSTIPPPPDEIRPTSCAATVTAPVTGCTAMMTPASVPTSTLGTPLAAKPRVATVQHVGGDCGRGKQGPG